jgi:hypothetical protein
LQSIIAGTGLDKNAWRNGGDVEIGGVDVDILMRH